MPGTEDPIVAHQRQRWMRPNAHLWIRPDAWRFMPAGTPRLLGKETVRYFWPEPQSDRSWEARERKYSPNQARVPAGNPDGGQWTGGGGNSTLNDSRVVSDANPGDEWKPGAQYAQLRSRSGPVLINGRWVQPTPAQAARLAVAEARSRDGVQRVREFDPNWRPQASAFDSVEGLIAAHRADALQAEARVSEWSRVGVGLGPYAHESISARGPEREFSLEEHFEINRIFQKRGCHTCGTFNPGTKSGNAVIDHQPPSGLNYSGKAQRLYPQCVSCSLRQGGWVQQLRRSR